MTNEAACRTPHHHRHCVYRPIPAIHRPQSVRFSSRQRGRQPISLQAHGLDCAADYDSGLVGNPFPAQTRTQLLNDEHAYSPTPGFSLSGFFHRSTAVTGCTTLCKKLLELDCYMNTLIWTANGHLNVCTHKRRQEMACVV